VDCRKLDYDTVVSAIGSHQTKFKCDKVYMTFERDDGEEMEDGGGGEE